MNKKNQPNSYKQDNPAQNNKPHEVQSKKTPSPEIPDFDSKKERTSPEMNRDSRTDG